MAPEELDAALEELESRLDRLRALYDQYFLGIEKIEPTVQRKDVDRRIWLMRREQIRNTARRFKLQTLVQRYNTFQQYWARVCRDIENGTYARHLIRAEKVLGDLEPLTIAARKRAGMFRRGAEKRADREKTIGEPASEPPAAAESEKPPESAATPLAHAIVGQSGRRPAAANETVGQSGRTPAAANETVGQSGRRPAAANETVGQSGRTPAAANQEVTQSEPPPPPAPGVAVAKVALVSRIVPVERAGPPATPVTPPGAPAPARVPAQTQARPPARPAPLEKLDLDMDFLSSPRALAPPLPPPREPKPSPAPPPPAPTTAFPPPARAKPLDASRPPPVPSREPRPPPARVAPPAPTPNAPAASDARSSVSEQRVKEIHTRLVDAKRKCNEGTDVNVDVLARSLRAVASRLRERHGDRSVDFDVVIKDGKAVIKPILR